MLITRSPSAARFWTHQSMPAITVLTSPEPFWSSTLTATRSAPGATPLKRPRAVLVEHLDGDEIRAGGDAVEAAPRRVHHGGVATAQDDPRHVRAMAVIVIRQRLVVHEVFPGGQPARRSGPGVPIAGAGVDP